MSAGANNPVERLLCQLEDLTDGRSRGFDPLGEGRDTMFVVRRGASVFAYRNACPHYDFARMAWKKNEYLNANHSRIMCSAHGALFRIEDGVCDAGACIGEALAPVPLEIRGGSIWLCGEYAPGLRRAQNPNRATITHEGESQSR